MLIGANPIKDLVCDCAMRRYETLVFFKKKTFFRIGLMPIQREQSVEAVVLLAKLRKRDLLGYALMN